MIEFSLTQVHYAWKPECSLCRVHISRSRQPRLPIPGLTKELPIHTPCTTPTVYTYATDSPWLMLYISSFVVRRDFRFRYIRLLFALLHHVRRTTSLFLKILPTVDFEIPKSAAIDRCDLPLPSSSRTNFFFSIDSSTEHLFSHDAMPQTRNSCFRSMQSI